MWTWNQYLHDFQKKIPGNILIKRLVNSTALKTKTRYYPEGYVRKVPLRVKMLKTVKSELPPPLTKGEVCVTGGEYWVEVGMHGAVTAILVDGKSLGLKPWEFEVLHFHEDEAASAEVYDALFPKATMKRK